MQLFTSDKGNDSKDFSKGVTVVFSSLTERFGNYIIIAALFLFSVSLYGVNQLTVENRFIDYFKPSTEIYKGMELLDAKLGGTAHLEIVINAPIGWDQNTEEDNFDDDFGFEDDELNNGYWWNTISLDQLEEIHDYVDSLPEIGKVLSVASGIKVARELKLENTLSKALVSVAIAKLAIDIKKFQIKEFEIGGLQVLSHISKIISFKNNYIRSTFSKFAYSTGTLPN